MASLREYFQTTFEEKLLGQVPEEENNYLTPATRLLEKRREMTEVEGALSNQKEDFSLRMDALQMRRKELEDKEQQLEQSLQKFDKFLKENESRRKRALKKIKDERDLTEAKEVEMKELRVELERLRQKRDRQRQAIAKQQVFENYLRRVVATTPEFNEIVELMDRHATLSSTNKDLLEREAVNQGKMDKIKAEARRFKDDHRVAMLSCNNELAELQNKLEAAQAECLFWENAFIHAQHTATKRTLLLGRIKMAAANLYALTQKRSGNREREIDTSAQLAKVQTFIQDLQDVTSEYESQLAVAAGIRQA